MTQQRRLPGEPRPKGAPRKTKQANDNIKRAVW